MGRMLSCKAGGLGRVTAKNTAQDQTLFRAFDRSDMRAGNHPKTDQCNIHRRPLALYNFDPLRSQDASCNMDLILKTSA